MWNVGISFRAFPSALSNDEQDSEALPEEHTNPALELHLIEYILYVPNLGCGARFRGSIERAPRTGTLPAFGP